VRPRFGDDPGVSADEALASVVRLLGKFGFQPRLEHTKTGEQIAMRPCPFGEMATRNGSIICPVHLGLIRGTLEALRAPIEATLLEPFAKPAGYDPKEYELLLLLASHPGRAFSREFLLQHLWGYDYDGFDRTVDTHITRLRKKLGALGEKIVTVWGVGYRFVV